MKPDPFKALDGMSWDGLELHEFIIATGKPVTDEQLWKDYSIPTSYPSGKVEYALRHGTIEKTPEGYVVTPLGELVVQTVKPYLEKFEEIYPTE